jgi:hypothetical protein
MFKCLVSINSEKFNLFIQLSKNCGCKTLIVIGRKYCYCILPNNSCALIFEQYATDDEISNATLINLSVETEDTEDSEDSFGEVALSDFSSDTLVVEILATKKGVYVQEKGYSWSRFYAFNTNWKPLIIYPSNDNNPVWWHIPVEHLWKLCDLPRKLNLWVAELQDKNMKIQSGQWSLSLEQHVTTYSGFHKTIFFNPDIFDLIRPYILQGKCKFSFPKDLPIECTFESNNITLLLSPMGDDDDGDNDNQSKKE